MQVSFNNVLRGENVRNTVSRSCLGVRKKLANCCWRLRGFKKGKTDYVWWIQGLKTKFDLKIRYLEVKKQDAKYDWFPLRLKCNKKLACIAFRPWNASSKVRLRYLEVLKHQERLSDISKGSRDEVIGCKTLKKVNPMYLELKFKEIKFNWWV